MAVEARPKGEVVTLKTPLLSNGRTTSFIVQTDLLGVAVKVYAEGGENVIHAHAREEHMFLVLAGQATFHLGKEERAQVVNRFEGVLLPAKAYYWFQSSGDRNLVMVRVGARYPGEKAGRLTPDGRDIPGDSPENKQVPRIERPGKWFGA